MSNDGMNDFWAAQLTARQIQEDAGMTMDEVLKLDMAEYARLSHRPTPTQAALAAIDAQHERGHQSAPAAPESAPEPPESGPQGIDIASMDMDTYAAMRGQLMSQGRPDASPGITLAEMTNEQYAAVRGQLGMGKSSYGRGALDGGSTAEWIAAAQRQPGRSAMQGKNVETPSLTGRYVRQDEHRDTRSLSERFGTPGNAYRPGA